MILEKLKFVLPKPAKNVGEEMTVEISQEQLREYFNKNDEVDRSVPVAIIRQMKDNVVERMAAAESAEGMDLARMQGELIALARFGKLYAEAMEAAKEQMGTIEAGGMQDDGEAFQDA